MVGPRGSRDTDLDDMLFHHFSYPSNGRPLLHISTPLFNKLVGKINAAGMWDVCLRRSRGWVHLRNIKIGEVAIIRTLRIGAVARVGGFTYIHNLAGRMTNTTGSAFQIYGAHHFGRDSHSPSCKLNPPLPSHVRVVYIDTRKLKWASVGSVAFHSFAWPRDIREVRGVARTLFINHCGWDGVLEVRGRCFGPNKFCLRANRILEDVLWNWACGGRPYLVYREGREAPGGGDPIP